MGALFVVDNVADGHKTISPMPMLRSSFTADEMDARGTDMSRVLTLPALLQNCETVVAREADWQMIKAS